MYSPLPEKIRAKSLNEYVGQKHIAGKSGIVKKLLTSAKKSNFFPSLILWGPPGSGKTTLARIISNDLNRDFFEFSAVNTSIKDIQNVIDENKGQKGQNKLFLSPVIFLDEIHRFNKAQQDRLLPHVEKGGIILIGATTENPSYEVIGPLLSRCRVLTLNLLSDIDIGILISRGLVEMDTSIDKSAIKFLIESSNGDARVALNVLEIASNLSRDKTINLKNIEDALQKRQYTFDKNGEDYYNTISAFIKSMRASQPNAALYYLARMIEAGQDPLYIARRMVIFSSEDIGLAQPTAIVVANEVFRACETIGYPECSLNLAHGALYLAKAKKDRSIYDGINAAKNDVKKFGNLPIPMSLRNPNTKLMEEIGYGKGYEKYTKKSLLPEKIKDKKYIE